MEVEAGASVRQAAQKYGLNPGSLSRAVSIFRELSPQLVPRVNAELQTTKTVKRPIPTPKRHRHHVEPRVNAGLRVWLFVIISAIFGGVILAFGVMYACD